MSQVIYKGLSLHIKHLTGYSYIGHIRRRYNSAFFSFVLLSVFFISILTVILFVSAIVTIANIFSYFENGLKVAA